jgi:predicted PolB exonuclease-like 3'-5' exonuclease
MAIEKVLYGVEATEFEQNFLQQENSIKCVWTEISLTETIQIGEYEGHPVMVELSWAVIKGTKVLFWRATSNVVDYRMVQKWVRENALTKDATTTNAMNFHNVFNYLPEEKPNFLNISSQELAILTLKAMKKSGVRVEMTGEELTHFYRAFHNVKGKTSADILTGMWWYSQGFDVSDFSFTPTALEPNKKYTVSFRG